MRLHCLASLFVFAGCILFPGSLLARAAPPALPASKASTRDTFTSGGKRITVECFEPAGSGSRPAVLLLHGLDGVGALYRRVGKRLAAKGYVAFLVHYFDRTVTTKEDLPALLKQFQSSLDKKETDPRVVTRLDGMFTAWQETVRDAVRHARRHSRVDSRRVALVGGSLGGFLAVEAAARDELNIACVAELFGGRAPGSRTRPGRMPPTLILHGDRDTTVPVREALALRDHLRARKQVCEMHIYRGVGHGFKTDGGLCLLSALDAERRAMAFLAHHLGKPERNETFSSCSQTWGPSNNTRPSEKLPTSVRFRVVRP